MIRTPLERWVGEKIGNGREVLTRQRLECYQLAKLNETIAWARTNSAFYKEHLAPVRGALSGLDELRFIPFTTALDVKQQPLRFLCVSQSEIQRVVTLRTTGTTGEAKRVFFTEQDQELTIDFFHRGMATLVNRGESVLILLPGERPGSVGDLLATGLARLGVRGIGYGPVQDYDHALEVMRKERVEALVGIPVQVLALARRSEGRDAPRSVLLSTDYVPRAVRDELARIWGCDVFTHYGMTEMGYGGGVECRARRGYHMREADLFFEIVDPQTGVPVQDGETGEVVFTTLTRRGMPLIRYRTGDSSRFLVEQCPCGTVLKTMAPVNGRLTNQLELEPGLMLTMAALDETLFPIPGVVDFTVELTQRLGRNHLEIMVTMSTGSAGGRLGELRQALGGIVILQTLIRKGRLGLGLAIQEGNPQPLNGVTKRTLTDMRNRGD